MKRATSCDPKPASIYCVGKNYRLHAEEMRRMESTGDVPQTAPGHPDEPIIFLKPFSALSTDGTTAIPTFGGKPVSGEMHYEAELVLLVGKDADDIGQAETAECISGYGVGLDMTLRDVQLAAKKKGEPWFKSKGFKRSALVSDFVPSGEVPGIGALEFELRLNDRTVQRGDPDTMLFDASYLLSYLSYIYGLRKGDLIFTGTPEGVGPVRPGDRLHATLRRKPNGGTALLAELSATVE